MPSTTSLRSSTSPAPLLQRRHLAAILATIFAPCAYAQASTPATADNTAKISELAPIEVYSTFQPRSQLDTPAAVSRLDSEDLTQGRPAIHLSESLAAVPGIQVQNRNNYAQDLQLSIRGFGARSTFGIRGVRIYVDGIPATMPDGQGQLSNVDLLSASSVEVLRGPYSALYGNSSGGVLLIETARGSGPPKLTGGLVAGSDKLRRYSLQASGATGNETGLTAYNLSASRLTLDGWREHSEASKNLGNARLDFVLPDASELTLVASYSAVNAEDPLGLNAEDFENNPRGVTPNALAYNTRKHVRQSQAGLRYEKKLSADTRLQGVVYAGERSMTQYQAIPAAAQRPASHAGGVIGLRRNFAGVDLRATHDAQWLGRPLSVTGGMAYDYVHEDRRGYENFLGSAATPSALGVKGQLRRDEGNRLQSLDPYLQATWEWTERWSVEGGLRYSTVKFRSNDHYQANGDDSGKASYHAWLPVLALRYAVTPETSLYASAGRGFETPTFNELSYRPDGAAGLNFALQPSTSSNYELGAKTRALGGLLTAALFQINTHDEIVSASSSGGRSTFRNAGKTRRHGLELSWDGELARDLRFTAAYTWLDARFRGQEDDGLRIPGVARHSGFVSLRHAPATGWQAGAEWRLMGDIQANTANTADAAGYGVVAIHTGYALAYQDWDLNSFVRIDNLFDHDYAGSVIVNESNRRYYEPASGRSWTVGVNAAYRF